MKATWGYAKKSSMSCEPSKLQMTWTVMALMVVTLMPSTRAALKVEAAVRRKAVERKLTRYAITARRRDIFKLIAARRRPMRRGAPVAAAAVAAAAAAQAVAKEVKVKVVWRMCSATTAKGTGTMLEIVRNLRSSLGKHTLWTMETDPVRMDRKTDRRVRRWSYVL